MKRMLQFSLVFCVFAAAVILGGCQKEETATPPASTTAAAPAPAGGAAPAPAPPGPNAPAGGPQSQMTKALNDPNTPPQVKEQIRQQMGGK